MKKFYTWLFNLISKFVFLLPQSVQEAMGTFLGILWFDVLRIRRRVALNNLELAYPKWPKEEKIKVARASCVNIGMTFIEFLRIPHITKSDLRWFEFEGLNHLESALDKKRGVCLLSLHIGNLDWATAGLNLAGYKFSIISKEFNYQWLNDIWFGARSKMGNRFIAPRRSSMAILKSLKENEIVCFVLDQYMGPPLGVKTSFFGVETGTAMGLSILAGRSQAAVVPVYTYRRPDGVTVVHFDAEIPFEEKETREETVRHMTQVYCDKLEEYVRICPEQWMWVHRRWKKFTS